MNEEFYKSDKALWRSTHVMDAFGEVHKLTPIDKQIYSYLFDRHSFFKAQRKQYFDSNKDMCYWLGVVEKTIARSTVFLHEVGLIDKEIKIYRNLPKNVYNQVYDFEVLTDKIIRSLKYRSIKEKINVE